MTGPDFDHFCALVRARSGFVITPDKGYLVRSRLDPIARSLGLGGAADLLARLRRDNPEPPIERCVEAMAIHELFFFRDGAPFQQMTETVLPALIAARRVSKTRASGAPPVPAARSPIRWRWCSRNSPCSSLAGGSRSSRPTCRSRSCARPAAASTAISKRAVACRRSGSGVLPAGKWRHLGDLAGDPADGHLPLAQPAAWGWPGWPGSILPRAAMC